MATTAKIPIGITLPIQRGISSYFEQSYDTLSQVKSNITNLLNTRPGERRMQPLFFCRLWNLAFEQNTDIITEIAKNIIEEDITSWIPGVTILNTDVSLLKREQSIDNRDIYRLHIVVEFMVNSTKQSDSIELNVDNNF